MSFVAGHVIWSFCIPSALVEALHPPSSDRPWLRRPGLVVVTVLYLAAAALILSEHLATELDHASPAQVAGALATAALLVAAAATVGRREQPARDTSAPRPVVVGLLAVVAAFAFTIVPPSWTGTLTGLTVLAATSVGTVRLSRSRRWSGRHVVALATGALTAKALIGFLAEPLGDVAPLAKYAHNTAFLVGSLALGVWAARRSSTCRSSSALPCGTGVVD
jgi:hypothetical protein